MRTLESALQWESPYHGEGSKPAPAPYRPLDGRTRAVAVDMVRKALGTAARPYAWPHVRFTPDRSAVTLMRAVKATAAMLSHPDATAARAAALAIPSNGTMQPFPSAPDPFTVREHESVTKRNRKRIATFERRHIGRAPVIGDRYEVTAPYNVDAPDALTVWERRNVSADLVALAPNVLSTSTADAPNTADALTLYRLTQRHFAHRGLERLIGIDPTGWHQTGRIDRSDVVPASAHRAQLDGVNFRTRLGDLEPFDGVFGSRTRQRTTWETRSGLGKLELRKGERGPVTTLRLRTVADAQPLAAGEHVTADGHAFYSPGLLGYANVVVAVTAEVARNVTLDSIWRGHTLSARPGKSRAQRKARRGKRAQIKRNNDARTVATFNVADLTDAAEWLAAASVPKGKRHQVIGDNFRATITRADKPNGRFSAVSYVKGERQPRITARTADRVAILLSAIASAA